MKDSHYRISLDIHSTQSQVSLPVKQGDTSRKVFISLCEGGKPYHIEDDCFAVFSAKKPDKTIIENNCIIADNVIEYSITEQTSAVSGKLDCEIKLYGGDSGLITAPRFTVIVDARAVSDAEIESTSEYSALTELYTVMSGVDAKFAKGKSLVTNALKGSASGDFITLTDVSPLDHEMVVNVGTAGAKVYRSGKNLFDGELVNAVRTYEDGKYYTNNKYVTNANLINIIAGKEYTLKFISSVGKFNGVVFYKSDETFLSSINFASTTPNPCTFTTPSEAAYFSFNISNLEAITPADVQSVQLEYGKTATEFEKGIGCIVHTADKNGTVDNVTSLYPTTVLTTDTEGVVIDVEYNRDVNKVVSDLISIVYQGNLGRIAHIDLAASKWQGNASPYSQVVSISGVTENSKVDINPSIEQLAIFHEKDIAFVAENEDGVVTVYCVGQKPTADYQMQITVTEVFANA